MSHSETWFFDLAGNIARGIGARTAEAIGKVFEDTGDFDGLDPSFVQIGAAFYPDPITPASYAARGPYANPSLYKERMEESVGRGWLESVGDDQYALTEKSQKWAKKFQAMGDEFFGSLPMLSEAETERLLELLTKFLKKASHMPDVGDLPTLQIGLKLEPGANAHLMTRLRRKVTDLFYFRDDVHIVAWKPCGVDGKTWETLTNVWREDAATAAALAENLTEYRNYTEDDYAAALNDLAAKGWIVEDGDKKYVATDEGKRIRQEAEDKTDEFFYAPLKAFNETELAELKGLMEKLAEVLAPPEEEEASEAEASEE
jgi:hypothetical protein